MRKARLRVWYPVTLGAQDPDSCPVAMGGEKSRGKDVHSSSTAGTCSSAIHLGFSASANRSGSTVSSERGSRHCLTRSARLS